MRKTNPWPLCLQTLQQAAATGELHVLLEVLLTPGERDDLGKRCRILAELLAQTTTQRAIAAQNNVSLSKVIRGAAELKRVSPQVRRRLAAWLGTHSPPGTD